MMNVFDPVRSPEVFKRRRVRLGSRVADLGPKSTQCSYIEHQIYSVFVSNITSHNQELQ